MSLFNIFILRVISPTADVGEDNRTSLLRSTLAQPSYSKDRRETEPISKFLPQTVTKEEDDKGSFVCYRCELVLYIVCILVTDGFEVKSNALYAKFTYLRNGSG